VLAIVFKKFLAEHIDFIPTKEWIDLPQRITIEWRVGDKIDGAVFDTYIPIHAQADGDEINYIVRYFTYIPIAYEPYDLAVSGKQMNTQRWHNDNARFIAEHLPRR
jgi:hypothetical protein